MKKNENKMVERDADGIPSAWRLFKIGQNPITEQSGDAVLQLSAHDISTIVERHQQKGLSIPIDGQHFLYHVAKSQQMDEDDLAASDPYRDGVGTLGFGRLQSRPSGLWIEIEKWNPAARALLAEGQYRFYSPVIKGLDGKTPLRVTSVGLTNTPKLNDVPELVASEIDLTFQHPLNRKDSIMDPEKKKEAVCADPVAPPAESEPTVESLTKENETLKKEIADLKKQIAESAEELGLAEVTPAKMAGALKGLNAKASQFDALKSKVESLELAENNRQFDTLSAQGLAKGQLSNGQMDTFRKLGVEALAEYLKTAPENKVPQQSIGTPAVETVALSDDEKQLAVFD